MGSNVRPAQNIFELGGVSSMVKLSVSKTELLGSNPSSPAISAAVSGMA